MPGWGAARGPPGKTQMGVRDHRDHRDHRDGAANRQTGEPADREDAGGTPAPPVEAGRRPAIKRAGGEENGRENEPGGGEGRL